MKKTVESEGISLLMVEDDDELRECFQEIMNSLVSKVYTVNGAEQALLMLEKGIRPNVYFVDVFMPGIGGLEFMRLLRRIHREAKIIATSADGSNETRQKAIEAGANCFLEKPFSIANLTQIISTMTNQEA